MVEIAEFNKSIDFTIFHHVGIDVKDIKKAFKRAKQVRAEVLVLIRLVQTNGIETKQAFLKRT